MFIVADLVSLTKLYIHFQKYNVLVSANGTEHIVKLIVSYCIMCAYTHKPDCTSMHVHFVHCEIFDVKD